GIPVAALDEHRADNERPFDIKPEPSDLACLIYTSGTTGPSKGCMISYNFMCNLARLQLRAGPGADHDAGYDADAQGVHVEQRQWRDGHVVFIGRA
ncbi:AMP-binding protein, partial [Pseudomonas aeruginosa]